MDSLRFSPGQRVLIADGVGRPSALSPALSAAAREAGGVRLVLGFVVTPDPGLELDAFAEVRTFMGGWGLRRDLDAGRVHYLPTRIGTVPALVAGPLRPDVVVVSVVETPRGLTLGTEVSYVRAAIATGARVLGVLRTGLPACDAGPAVEGVEILVEDASPAVVVPAPRSTPEHLVIARQVAGLLPDGARLQIGPGPLGAAVLDAAQRPLVLDTGMIVDGVVGLDERGLLAGMPMATYLVGSELLYGWAAGRQLLHGVEVTHHPGRLMDGGPFVAVNTALEIDLQGNVNVESVGGSTVGGIGGHPDYSAAAATSPGGLSIIAVPTQHAGRPLLVEQLSGPASSAGHDVDVVVNERGHVDLRGLDRAERAAALVTLWDGDVARG